MARPKLLLLDEPSLGLAPIFVERIFDIIKQINEQGTSILLVEQNALMALDAANRGYVLETGRIVLADNAAALKTNEQVRKTYLGETWTGETRQPSSPNLVAAVEGEPSCPSGNLVSEFRSQPRAARSGRRNSATKFCELGCGG
jgi:ABC-type multidrug transport system ATPase subunit